MLRERSRLKQVIIPRRSAMVTMQPFSRMLLIRPAHLEAKHIHYAQISCKIPPPPGGGIFCAFVVVSLNSISTTYTPTGGYGIRPYGLPIPLHSACRQLRRGGGTPPYILPKKGTVGRPALWPPCPLPATANLPCNPPTLTPQGKSLPLTREAGLSKNCIPALLRV